MKGVAVVIVVRMIQTLENMMMRKETKMKIPHFSLWLNKKVQTILRKIWSRLISTLDKNSTL